MNTYEVRFNVDGRSGGSVMVEARDSLQAKRIAMGEINGRLGYAGKRIVITSAIKR